MWWLVTAAVAVPRPELRLHLGKAPLEGRTICYPSGLQVHAVSRPATGIVAVSAVIDGGMAGETDEERGAAHLAEHLWFQARAIGGVPVEQTLSGLEYDAFTGVDATVFVTVGAAQDLQHLLEIEAVRLSDPFAELQESVFAAERARVRSEILWRGEHSVRRAFRELEDALWPTSFPYRGAIATAQQNDGLTLEVVREHARRAWVPSAATLRIEGEIELATIHEVLEAAIPLELRLGQDKGDCGHAPVGGPPPAPASTALTQVSAGVLEPLVLFGWSLPAGYGEADVIGRAAAEWIELRLRADLDLRLACEYEPRRRSSVVQCSAEVPAGLAAEAVADRVAGKLRELWTDDLTERTEWVALMVGALDGALSSADSFELDALEARALFSHYTGEHDPMTHALEEVLAFQESALVELGRSNLTKSRMVTISVVPGQVPVAERSGRIAALAGLGAPRAAPWAVPEVRFDGWRAEALPNGVEVWVVPRAQGAPLSQVALGFDRGSAVGVPGAGATQARRWATTLPLSFGELLDATATAAWTEVAPVQTRVAAMGPSGNLDAQLFLVHQLGTAPRMGGSHAAPASPTPELRALEDRLSRLFPDHSLSRVRAEPTRRRDAVAWRSGVLRPENATLVLAGWIDPEESVELAEQYFGRWKGPRGAPLDLLPPPEPGPRALHAIGSGTTLASLEVACRLPGRTPQNDAAIDVAAFLIHEGVSQSLRSNGGTYLAEAGVTELGPAGVLTLRTAVGPEEAADALSAMYGLLELVGAGPPEDVLHWARSGVKSEFSRSLASIGSSFEVVLSASRNGTTLEQLKAYPDRVDAVDSAAVAGVLAGCVEREAATYVGPKVDLAPYEPTWVE